MKSLLFLSTLIILTIIPNNATKLTNSLSNPSKVSKQSYKYRATDGDITVIQSSASGDAWTPQPSLNWGADFPSSIDVTVNYTWTKQEILGFGSALTDTSAYNSQVWMNPTTYEAFLEAMWGETGLGFTVHRITLNSADYSFKSFNYDNVTDDFSLQYFDHNVTYDQQRVIPLIKSIMQKSADPIRFFASPWSPPGWIKQNGNMINSDIPCLKNDTSKGSYKQTWAQYITYWIQAFENQGIPIWGLTPQNEPLACQKEFESCYYGPDDMVDFIANHLGPTVKSQFPQLKLMAYDHNKIAAFDYVSTLYNNSASSQYFDGAALHWYDYFSSLGLDSLDGIHALRPDRFMLGTEACYLNSFTFPWRIGELYIADIFGDLNHWVSGWLQWNTVLLSGTMYPQYYGGPNHDGSTFGDPVIFEYNSTGTQRLIFQSAYYIIGHISRYARPGSYVINSTGQGVANSYADYESIRDYSLGKGANPNNLPLVAVGFVSSDNQVTVVVANPNDDSRTFKLRDIVGSKTNPGVPRAVQTTIGGHTIQTFVYNI